jgi:hypothetical protein
LPILKVCWLPVEFGVRGSSRLWWYGSEIVGGVGVVELGKEGFGRVSLCREADLCSWAQRRLSP